MPNVKILPDCAIGSFFLLDSLLLRIYGRHCSIDQLTGFTIYQSMMIHPMKEPVPNSRVIASNSLHSPLRAIQSIPVVCRSSMYGFGRRNVSPNSYPSCYGTRCSTLTGDHSYKGKPSSLLCPAGLEAGHVSYVSSPRFSRDRSL